MRPVTKSRHRAQGFAVLARAYTRGLAPDHALRVTWLLWRHHASLRSSSAASWITGELLGLLTRHEESPGR